MSKKESLDLEKYIADQLYTNSQVLLNSHSANSLDDLLNFIQGVVNEFNRILRFTGIAYSFKKVINGYLIYRV